MMPEYWESKRHFKKLYKRMLKKRGEYIKKGSKRKSGKACSVQNPETEVVVWSVYAWLGCGLGQGEMVVTRRDRLWQPGDKKLS